MPYLRIFAISAFLAVAAIPDALAISRCIVNGQTVFQDTPCVGSLGTHAEDFNRRAKQQEIDNERLLQNSLAEAAMQPEERSKRAQKSEALARSAVVERMIDPKSTDLRNVRMWPEITSLPQPLAGTAR